MVKLRYIATKEPDNNIQTTCRHEQKIHQTIPNTKRILYSSPMQLIFRQHISDVKQQWNERVTGECAKIKSKVLIIAADKDKETARSVQSRKVIHYINVDITPLQF